MLKQTDPRFSKAIYHFGCYIFSLINVAGIRQGKDFDFDQIESIYKSAMQSGIVGPEQYDDNGNATGGCFVNDAQAFLNLCGSGNATILMNPSDKLGMWPTDDPQKNDPSVSIIQEWQHDAFTHFVTGNPDGSVEFDSIDYGDGLGSNTVRYGQCVALRLIKFA